jgi:hypothetical protein
MRPSIYLILVLLLSACFVQPALESKPTANAPFVLKSVDNPNPPKSEDLNLTIGGVVLNSLDLSEQTGTNPVQVKLNLLGSLPRACDQLRMEVSDPNQQYQILIRVYSLVNPRPKCENVFQQFETSILLGVYSPGRYTVVVNGSLVGDFVSY